MTNSKSKKSIQIPGRIKKALVIFISGVIIFYYFHNYSWLDILNAVKRSNFIFAVLSILIPQLFFWYIEVFITKMHINWFHGDFPFNEYFWVRGIIYFLVMINPSIGLGGITLYIRRKTKMNWGKLFGILSFRYLLTIWGICLLLIPVTLLMKIYWVDEYNGINLYIWWAVLSLMILWMIGTWFFWYNKKYFVKKQSVRNTKNDFWTAFRTATARQWLITWIIGLAPYLVYLAGIYFQSVAFGMNIPLLRYIILSPIAVVVADLPIAFSGFGTTTMSFMAFFGNYGVPESILALTLFLPFSRAIIRALIGVVSIKYASKEIDVFLKKNME